MLNSHAKRGEVSRRAVVFTVGAFLCFVMPFSGAVLAILQAPPPVVPIPNSIEGVVVRLGNNEPISDVDVELRRVEGTPAVPLGPLVLPPGNFSPGAIVLPTYPNPSDIAHVRTKSDGRFLFTNLKPGAYRLQAARAGGAYFPAEYGAIPGEEATTSNLLKDSRCEMFVCRWRPPERSRAA
jgi:hypothetical protein